MLWRLEHLEPEVLCQLCLTNDASTITWELRHPSDMMVVASWTEDMHPNWMAWILIRLYLNQIWCYDCCTSLHHQFCVTFVWLIMWALWDERHAFLLTWSLSYLGLGTCIQTEIAWRQWQDKLIGQKKITNGHASNWTRNQDCWNLQTTWPLHKLDGRPDGPKCLIWQRPITVPTMETSIKLISWPGVLTCLKKDMLWTNTCC